MDSIKRDEANTISHHQEKVVSSDLGIHSSNKNINSNNNTNVINNKNQQLASTHSTEIKDTNFEYDDNEWDIGIGNLIIDLDADIEKSQISIQQSNTHIDNSLTIPSSSSSSTSQSKSTDSTDKLERKDSSSSKQGDKKASSSSVTASVNTKNQEEKVTMSSSTSSGNKPSAKLSIDHQATLDKGLKMKIKRTKTGTKTSEAKHEIVKAEQNGTTTSSDEGNTILNSNKRHSQIPVSPMPGSPSPATNKRGTSSHKKDKTKEKTCHSQKDKSDLSGSSASDRNICSCGSEITANGFQSSCTNLNCVKNRSNEMSLAQRLSSNQITSNDRQNSTPNAPGPPFKDVKTPLQSQSNNSSSSNSRDGMMNESSLKAQLTGNSSLPLSGIANSISLSSSSGASSVSEDSKTSSPPLKRIKCDPKDMVDVCVGTSVGTITEPDCLGPCEPGTSVTLEGIVWHETEGGVLAVNVTWRGKTYVGTLIDCTKHDWAPPRFCDSPTEELDSRTPKGRGKRGRSALTPTNDLSNFTETRSSMHSKLRNGGAKGRGGRNTTTSSITSTTNTSTNSSSNSSSNTSSSAQGNSNTPPSTSPTAFLVPRPEKRKSKDESPSPVNVNGNSAAQSNRENSTSGSSNSQTTKKPKNLTSPCAISPVLIECPEQDCSKKYKHANGLKYHQSHAHGIVTTDEDSSQAPESPHAANSSSPQPQQSTTAPSTTTTATTTTQIQSSTTSNNPPPNSITTNSNSNSSDTNNISQNNSTTATPSVQANNNQTNNIKSESSSSSSNESTGPLALVPGTPMTSQSPSLNETKSSIAIDPLAPTLSTLQQQLNDSKQISNIAAENLSQQPGAITTTPTRTDGQSKVKPGVLRFGPLPTDVQQQPPNPNNTQGKPPSINPLPEQAIYPPSASQNSSNKAQNLINKQKKNRRSPGPGDFDSSMSNKNDDVRSPAYSDISDDSTTVADSDLSDKSKISQLPDAKKSQETGGPLSSLGGYSVYPFYSQSSFFSPESQSTKPPSIPPSPADYKNKEPPLDLINKQSQSDSKDLSGSSKNSQQGHPQHPPQQPPQQPTASSPAGKLMSHYPHYPYNYIPGYPYNMDPNYGQLQMMSEESKLANQGAGPPPNIKDERIKDISSPSDHSKQMLSSKLIKSEPKEIKSENLSVHPKDQPPSNLGPYLYPRHGMPQHISREEEFRRYGYSYPDRRSNVGQGNPTATNLSAKDERSSQSPHGSSQHSAGGMQLQGSSQQQQPKSMKNPSGSSSLQPTNLSNQKSSSNIKQEIKSEDKDVKVKQEGQKPTMETQGPPPPPTSQYYLHPPYMSPGFGFDPSLPVYRNMLVPTPPYNTPYHLQMSRYPTPEDLSRNTKALDLLQQHASQYYNTHKIHELSERALKSPTSNVKVSVSSPNVSAQQPGGPSGSSMGGPGVGGSGGDRGNSSGGNNSNSSSNVGGSSGNAPSVMSQPNSGSGSSTNLSLQQAPGSMNPNPSPGVIALNQNKNLDKGERGGGVSGPGSDTGKDASGSSSGGRSPPPQRHVHTHHHTHVGLGYPMYPASVPYGAAVLASQQAAAVAVINPFPAPNNK